MHELDKIRGAIRNALNCPEASPESSTSITRRTFIRKSLISGGLGAMTYVGWLPLVNTIDFASATGTKPFCFAWLSDTHLHPGNVNVVEKTRQAIKEIGNVGGSLDFLIFGGDLVQTAAPAELALGKALLSELKLRKLFIPGEHDWYLDFGKKWEQDFGKSPWFLDHKGVRLIGLNTVGQVPDYHSLKKMTRRERIGHIKALDDAVAGAWSALGPEQLKWLQNAVFDWPKAAPLIIFSHNPLYEYYPPWNFWVRDWREVHEILQGFTNVTNIHGHVHQPLYHEIGNIRSIGMPATAWSWPYAPEGIPALTKSMLRVDSGDYFDGGGWSLVTIDHMVPQATIMSYELEANG